MADAIATTTLRKKLAPDFVPLDSPMMQFHITPTQSPRKLKLVNRRIWYDLRTQRL